MRNGRELRMLYHVRKELRQLASLLPTAYTEFAAIHAFGGENDAAERACPLRQPGLKPVISFANYIP